MRRIAACCRQVGAVGGGLAIVWVLAGIVNAEYMQPDLEKIPLKRLIENLEAKVKDAPKDPEPLRHLARAYGMAYAAGLNDDSVVERWKGRDEVWFGFEPRPVPYAPPTGADPSGGKSRAFLGRAIECYKAALELDGTHLVTLLGLAWCTAQTVQKEEAVKLYREVLAEAWKQEGKRTFGGLGHFVTVETAGYLKRLLDPKTDGKEIAELDEKVKRLESLPRAITPVAVPLQDGLSRAELVDPRSVAFDLDGTGRRLRWQWIRPCAAWLVYDHDGSGRIASAVQMFGSRTFLLFMEHGYAAMALLDDDGNGTLEGRELEHLALWQDLNANGLSEPGEVKPLSAWKIVALSCRAETDADGSRCNGRGVTFEDGSVRATYDLVQRQAE